MEEIHGSAYCRKNEQTVFLASMSLPRFGTLRATEGCSYFQKVIMHDYLKWVLRPRDVILLITCLVRTLGGFS